MFSGRPHFFTPFEFSHLVKFPLPKFIILYNFNLIFKKIWAFTNIGS